MPKAWKIFQQEAIEDETENRKLRTRLSEVTEEYQLFRHPSWPLFESRLRELEDKDTDILIGAPLTEVEKIRERIKIVRLVLQIPKDLEREQRKLSEQLGLDTEQVEGEVS